MSEEKKQKIEVLQTGVFEKAFERLTEAQKDIVDEAIGKIIDNPEIGTRKKGNLSHLWVYKFKLEQRDVLLGYSWKERELEIYLLCLGPHENFYRDASRRRNADLKTIK